MNKRLTVIAAALCLSFLAFPHSGRAKEKPSSYEKCRMKCLTRHEACSKDAEKSSKRLDKLFRCDLKKRECLAKCE